MASIVIPAHNESGVIGRTLEALLPQADPKDEIVVVCNGCSDDTEAAASRYSPRVQVRVSEVASKVAALNLGDRSVSSFPRIYLDADIALEPGALPAIKMALANGRYLAVSPIPRMNLAQSSWPVRAYYDIWLSLPYCRSGMIGSGVYAMSETGRRRFGDFPNVIADDGFVRAQFAEGERGAAEGAVAVVQAPATLPWLLKIKARSRLGGMQLARDFPGLLAREEKNYGAAAREVFVNPLNWPKVAVYLYVNFLSRFLARKKMKALGQYRWEKDQSSRAG